MEPFYLAIIIFLFILAIFDLSVGVSNDAVNFLNSSIGAKAASFKTILIIAAAGIMVGASLSNGMMDIARHGIFQPQHFYFEEILCILLSVMIVDVVLLDIFNSLGMPTSTTVSLVFELLGGTFALALIKIIGSNGMFSLGELINTDKALAVILGIFTSVAIAFFFGSLVQYIARIIFSFNYKRNMRYFIGLFGGIAITSIIYFMLIKGLKDSSFMTPDNKEFIYNHTSQIVWGSLVFFTILMQVFYWMQINVFKIVILFGTFALALAFAGNDLVNFIGVPLAGYSSYLDLISHPNATPQTLLMTSLQSSAQTPWYFLVGSGIVMVLALLFSKKAHNVVKTELNLSRQAEGEESFGTSPIARIIVRSSNSIASSVISIVPPSIRKWIDTRFNRNEIILEDNAAYDLVRASVNVVLAGLLIALGTSLKLPLSTTYVTFMVAMGSSLADRAWGRESAVYRVTGVLSVIGGWFVTAGIAFFAGAIASVTIYFGGAFAIVILICLAIFILIKSQIMYKKKLAKNERNPIIDRLMNPQNSHEALCLLREYSKAELKVILEFAAISYTKTINAFMSEDYRGLRKSMNHLEDEKRYIKQVKRIGTLAISRLDPNVALEKGLYYFQGNDFASEIIYSIIRICDPCLEHTDNNFNPLKPEQKKEFCEISNDIKIFLEDCNRIITENTYNDMSNIIARSNVIINQLASLKKDELKRIQGHSNNIKIGMVYLTIIQEAQNVMSYAANLLKVSKKFQTEN
ncbi:MAG: inorganic phosphate transporter [Bacteroidaceae bacterium]|nr:inorganic phosphate transporter [Bacteroidaceae bacterium]